MSSEFHPCLSVFWQIEEINQKSGSSVADNSTKGFQKHKCWSATRKHFYAPRATELLCPRATELLGGIMFSPCTSVRPSVRL